jgi:RNA recognition motif-containing protein
MSSEHSPTSGTPQEEYPPSEPIKKTKIWAGGIPPRTSKEEVLNALIKAFSISSEEAKDIGVMIKLGYGFISIPDTIMARIGDDLQTASVCIESKSKRLDLS